jgi:LAO/AO transport system kinase
MSIVVTMPGAGDGVQALKAGVMEIGDLFVVNKADRGGSDRAVAEIEMMLGFNDYGPDDWRPPVLSTRAIDGSGVDALLDTVERFRARGGELALGRRRARVQATIRRLVANRFLQDSERHGFESDDFTRLVDRVVNVELDPYSAAEQTLAWNGQGKG